MFKQDEFGAPPRKKDMRPATEHPIGEVSETAEDLINEKYHDMLYDYFKCVSVYMNEFTSAQELGGQLRRRDLDTVCAYELYNMKKEFLTTNVLDFSQFVNKL